MMKQERHSAIKKILVSTPITSQDDLRAKLAERSCNVTQATLSRDIHELRLSKGPMGYVQTAGGEQSNSPDVADIVRSFALEARQASNLLVLITATGSAQPVAAAIDYENWPEVIGTIAGDDTVLIICAEKQHAQTLKARIYEYIG